MAEFVGEDVVQFGVLQDVAAFLLEPAFPLPGLLSLSPPSFVLVIFRLFPSPSLVVLTPSPSLIVILPSPSLVILLPFSYFTSADQWQLHGSVFVVLGMNIDECRGRGVTVARGSAFGCVAE